MLTTCPVPVPVPCACGWGCASAALPWGLRWWNPQTVEVTCAAFECGSREMPISPNPQKRLVFSVARRLSYLTGMTSVHQHWGSLLTSIFVPLSL